MSTDRSNAPVERWNDTHPRWSELMALPDVEDLHIEAKVQEWHLGIYTLVALQNDVIAGTLRFWTQVIGVDEDRPPFVVDGEPAVEAKVVTLHVLDEFREMGIGQQLQAAAVRVGAAARVLPGAQPQSVRVGRQSPHEGVARLRDLTRT